MNREDVLRILIGKASYGGRMNSVIERARAGDENAFDELARSRIDTVYRTALAILGSPADARDATQEALVAMWRGLPSLRSAEAFDGWLYRITVNACRMSLRRRRGVREIELEDGVATDSRATSDSTFGPAFDRLSVDQRALLVAHHLDGFSVADLAVRLGIPEGTVKSRLYTARGALEKALSAEPR
jgi:RNA polymerase sigma-70 factor (ECF subfamily)